MGNIMNVDIEKSTVLANEIKEILNNQKGHDIIASLTLAIANISVDMNISFEELLSDIDTTFVALCKK